MQYTKQRKPHNHLNLALYNNTFLSVDSDFDQGNLSTAKLLKIPTPQQIIQGTPKVIFLEVSAAPEPFNPLYSSKQSSKSFFNFSLSIVKERGSSQNKDKTHTNQQKLPQQQQKMIDQQNTNIFNSNINIDSSDESQWSSSSQINFEEYTIQQKQKDNKLLSFEDVNEGEVYSQLKKSARNLIQKQKIMNAQIHENIEKIMIQFKIKQMNVPCSDGQLFLKYYQPCIGFKNPNKRYSQPQYTKFQPDNMKLKKQKDGSFSFYFAYCCNFMFDLNQYQKYTNDKTKSVKSDEIYFAYHYPYSNQKLRTYTLNLQKKVHEINKTLFQQNQKQNLIYLRNQFLIQTVQGRPLNLLTLTSISQNQCQQGFLSEYFQKQQNQQNNQLKLNLEREPRISKSLFPFFDIENRCYSFKKPYFMITCRVHPGQSSSSYALEGFINKLIDGSLQSQFLLKTFTFKIIPILNPDGVYHGTYRMDPNGQNLNRFYDLSVSHKQPSIFAAQTLIHYYSGSPQSCLSNTQNILQIYLDFHAHSKFIPPFIYGNAYQSIIDQVESQLVCRVLDAQSQMFYEKNCSFSQKNMNSKDTVELMSKNGSARLCTYRVMKSIHGYTLQMGYLGYKKILKQKYSAQNEDITELEVQESDKNSSLMKILTDDDYRRTGQQLLQTLSQIYIVSLSYIIQNKTKTSIDLTNTFQIMRQQLGKQIYSKQQRFRIKQSMNTKIKNINNLAINNCYSELLKRYPNIQKYIIFYNRNKYPPQIQNQKKQAINYIKDKRFQTPSVVERAYQKKLASDTLNSHHPKSQTFRKQIQTTPPFRQNRQQQQDRKIFKNKISVTPIKFNIQDLSKKNTKYANLRKMIEFYSVSNNQETNIQQKNKRTEFKIKPPTSSKSHSKNYHRQSLSSNKTIKNQKKISHTNMNNNKFKKENSLNQQLQTDMQRQGFSFYLNGGSQSQRKIDRLNQNRIKKPEQRTISYDINHVQRNKFIEKTTTISPEKKFRIIREIRAEQNLRKNKKISNPAYKISNTEKMINNNIHRQTLRTPISSLGYVVGEEGVEQIVDITINTKMAENSINYNRNDYESSWKNRNAFLPKLQLLKPQKKLDKKYEIELKIKQKYDKKYKVQKDHTKNNFTTVPISETK